MGAESEVSFVSGGPDTVRAPKEAGGFMAETL
jgi:hypothetical protein